MKRISLLITYMFLFSTVGLSQLNNLRTLPTEIFRTIKGIPDSDTAKMRWKSGGTFNANLAQGTLSNWAAGGDDFSMSLNAYFNYYLLHRKGRISWDSNLDIYLGYVQTTSLGSRKNDDRVDFLSKYGYQLDKKWYLSALYSFRTQLFDGYTYYSRDSGTFVSTFLSPAYTLISVGMDYKPKDFSLFLSPATSRWTLMTDPYLIKQGLYGVGKGNHLQNEIGAFSSMTYNKTIWKVITYKGRLDLFTNYMHNPQNVDVYFTNSLAFKITKYIQASYNLEMIYDDDVKLFGPQKNSPALQLKSLIGIGFALNLGKKS
ncbi:DUF3078 domain-containing protein [Danxiaibacter flavus]|uniref:DUF3078 domain-containing protein n=1 Tax=Danxiaibacter flavus TaxID=3049108 RepID=A0ABV3ZBB7_9BACT|nr:DUF3078 domain-containing protein [Chitinophagaceae bacterium DXS]